MRNAYLSTLGVFAAVLTVIALATVILPGLANSVTADDDRGGQRFSARLRGSEEVTTPPGGVDTNTRGSAKLRFNRAKTKLFFDLAVEDGLRVTQAHIHCAPRGENGPVVVFLAGLHDRGWDVDGRWISNATATDANITNTACGATLAELAQAMKDGRTYVNVHTVVNPAGEVRGQVRGNGGDHDDDD
jgi:hypothetical protein